MTAAVHARGLTILENAAKEPHIVDLANFSQLHGRGHPRRGNGCDSRFTAWTCCGPKTYSIIPDQIEAGTYMAIAAATGGTSLSRT
jgi:UDP-N-acetylglucosamine 1-carboxyvinyltransferase